MIGRLLLLAALVACQRPYAAPCILTHTQRLVTANALSLVRTPEGHVRAEWNETSSEQTIRHAGEWDETGRLVSARQAALAPPNTLDALLVVDQATVFTGDALWSISPLFAAVPGAQTVTVQSLDPIGAPLTLFHCDDCALEVGAEAVADRIVVALLQSTDVASAVQGGVSFYSLDATGAIAASGVLPLLTAATLNGQHSEVLAASDSNGWSLFDENGVRLLGPIAIGGETFAWNTSAARAAFGWNAAFYGSEETFVARTDVRGVGPVVHVSSGTPSAVAAGATLTGVTFLDNGLFFSAMRASGEKLGGDVLLSAGGGDDFVFANAVMGEAAPGVFAIAYSVADVIALAEVTCQP